VASDTDIGNLALAHLGEDGTITSFNPPDGSVQAEHCARFYPIARDMCLEAHAWNFAQRTVQLTETLDAVNDYSFVYALPADCLKVLRVFPDDWRRDLTGIDEFEVETDANGQKILMCDLESPFLLYTRQIDDTSKFSPSFVVALSYLLASMLAGPVLKGETGQQANKYWFSVWRAYVGFAAQLDALNQRRNFDQLPSSIQARC
jgi:hypothetical protein